MNIVTYEEYLNSLSPVERKAELARNRMVLLEGGKLKKLPKKVYHMSPVENFDSIFMLGIKSNVEGAIFACPSIMDLLAFRDSAKYTTTLKDCPYTIWEIDVKKTRKDKWYLNVAYDKKVIKGKSIIYLDNDIPLNAIRPLEKDEVEKLRKKEIQRRVKEKGAIKVCAK